MGDGAKTGGIFLEIKNFSKIFQAHFLRGNQWALFN
jgi:hypothetical protein